MQGALDLRITLHIDAHLSDRELTANGIAAAHHISVRHLYTTWARAGHELSLAQWIIDRRLQGARELLDTRPFDSVAAIARACGFADTSHFSRRFREAYNVSPREWRCRRIPSPVPLSPSHGRAGRGTLGQFEGTRR